MSHHRVYLTWAGIESACITVADLLKPYNIKSILAVSRGGLVPASLIAYRLDVPVVGAVPPVVGTDSSDLAIIDDICDTGRTFKALVHNYPNALYAALFVKPTGMARCNVWAVKVNQNDWLVFPWAPEDRINR